MSIKLCSKLKISNNCTWAQINGYLFKLYVALSKMITFKCSMEYDTALQMCKSTLSCKNKSSKEMGVNCFKDDLLIVMFLFSILSEGLKYYRVIE